MQGSGFGVQGSGFRVQGTGFGVEGVGCRDEGLGPRGDLREGVVVEREEGPVAGRAGHSWPGPLRSPPAGRSACPVLILEFRVLSVEC